MMAYTGNEKPRFVGGVLRAHGRKSIVGVLATTSEIVPTFCRSRNPNRQAVPVGRAIRRSSCLGLIAPGAQEVQRLKAAVGLPKRFPPLSAMAGEVLTPKTPSGVGGPLCLEDS